MYYPKISCPTETQPNSKVQSAYQPRLAQLTARMLTFIPIFWYNRYNLDWKLRLCFSLKS